MADNLSVTQGSGTTIKTDDVSGAHYQYVKLADGTPDSSSVLPGDSTYGLRVDVTRVAQVLPSSTSASFVSGVTSDITTTAETLVLASAGTGLKNYVTDILVTNSHATVGTFVNIKDGSGGTILWSGYAAPAGGGFSCNLITPIKTSAATGLYCACVTTGANVRVSASGFKAA